MIKFISQGLNLLTLLLELCVNWFGNINHCFAWMYCDNNFISLSFSCRHKELYVWTWVLFIIPLYTLVVFIICKLTVNCYCQYLLPDSLFLKIIKGSVFYHFWFSFSFSHLCVYIYLHIYIMFAWKKQIVKIFSKIIWEQVFVVFFLGFKN